MPILSKPHQHLLEVSIKSSSNTFKSYLSLVKLSSKSHLIFVKVLFKAYLHLVHIEKNTWTIVVCFNKDNALLKIYCCKNIVTTYFQWERQCHIESMLLQKCNNILSIGIGTPFLYSQSLKNEDVVFSPWIAHGTFYEDWKVFFFSFGSEGWLWRSFHVKSCHYYWLFSLFSLLSLLSSFSAFSFSIWYKRIITSCSQKRVPISSAFHT